MAKIGIIGGGIAGLTAAYELGKRGHEAIVFERSEMLGGQVLTFPVEGTRLEAFYHHLFTTDKEIQGLVSELGIDDKLLWLESKMGFLHDGRVYPFATAMDLLRFKPIPFVDRVRLGVVALYLQRINKWKKLERVTAKAWITHYAGKKAFETVWGAQLRAKFGPYHDKVSMVWFWGKIHLRLASRDSALQKERLGYFKDSFSTLVDALAEGVRKTGGQIHAGVPINRVITEGEGDGLRAVGLDTGIGEYRLDAIISTVPSFIFERLVPNLPASYLNKIKSTQYLGAAVLVMKIPRPLSDIYWLNIGDADTPFVAVIEQTNFVPASNYGGKHLVYVSNYLMTSDPKYSMSAEELLELYTPYLRNINPQFDRSWVEDLWLFREAAAQPIITTHYSERIPNRRTPIANLYLANTTQIYPEDRGTNYSVRLGQQVVPEVLRDLGLKA